MNFGICPVTPQGRVRNTAGAPAVFNASTPIAANGVLSVVSSPPTSFLEGQGFAASGSLCIADGGVPTVYVSGLPYTADGRLCTERADPVRYGPGGAPITATGRVAFAVAEATGFAFDQQAFSSGFA